MDFSSNWVIEPLTAQVTGLISKRKKLNKKIKVL